METDVRKHIRLLLDDALETSQKSFHGRRDNILADHAARGLLKSGATIKISLSVMEELAAELITKLADDIVAVSRESEAFSMMQETIKSFIRFLGGQLDAIVEKIDGSQSSSIAESATMAASKQRFREMEFKLTSQIELHRFTFIELPSSQRLLPTLKRLEPSRSRKNNPGGKPLAKHWDQMWAAIAVQLWQGDLKPKRQADVKRAMEAWLDAQAIDASDTAIIERARCLWREIETSE